ncbi:hypothetical protein SADUNF_Sadunf11G0106700 [Salix dunnii]|uniref:Uncharacterized protein n=1 Tax=Salix dunnii TaxID=1413687 RepID=A0A835JMM4_9ROSI|nr:hypothetical protein SADUNF_Sadunf11G0106700 [Salix dunnii]
MPNCGVENTLKPGDRQSWRSLVVFHSKPVKQQVGYDYEITYKLGKENSATDALSRVIGSPSLNALFVPQTTTEYSKVSSWGFFNTRGGSNYGIGQ